MKRKRQPKIDRLYEQLYAVEARLQEATDSGVIAVFTIKQTRLAKAIQKEQRRLADGT